MTSLHTKATRPRRQSSSNYARLRSPSSPRRLHWVTSLLSSNMFFVYDGFQASSVNISSHPKPDIRTMSTETGRQRNSTVFSLTSQSSPTTPLLLPSRPIVDIVEGTNTIKPSRRSTLCGSSPLQPLPTRISSLLSRT